MVEGWWKCDFIRATKEVVRTEPLQVGDVYRDNSIIVHAYDPLGAWLVANKILKGER